MRAINQSISALVLGFSLLALGSTAQADSGVTVVYSTGHHVAYPYAGKHGYYAPRGLYRAPVCVLPYRGHSHGYRHDYAGHKYSGRKEIRWIDRHGYHHRDGHGYQNKYRHDDRKNQHQKSRHESGRSRTHSAYNSHGGRY